MLSRNFHLSKKKFALPLPLLLVRILTKYLWDNIDPMVQVIWPLETFTISYL